MSYLALTPFFTSFSKHSIFFLSNLLTVGYSGWRIFVFLPSDVVNCLENSFLVRGRARTLAG